MPTIDEEFVKMADKAMARLNLNKKILAKYMGIEQEYFSKLYNGHREVPSHIKEKLRLILSNQISHLGTERVEQLPKEVSQDMLHRLEERLIRIEKAVDLILNSRGSPPPHVKTQIGKKDEGATGTHGI